MTKPTDPLAASRPFGVARELARAPVDRDAVFSRRVILTGERCFLEHANGRWCFEDALRLLARTVGELDVVVPNGLPEFRKDVESLIGTMYAQGVVRLVPGQEPDYQGATAILNIGPSTRIDLPWTAVISNGWVARCSSGGTRLSAECSQSNPLGALLAASFGATEVFKRVYGIPSDVAEPYGDTAFSLFTMSRDFSDVGPPLPTPLVLPRTLLVGAGAIGNGVVLLASQMSLAGALSILDKQTFAPENLGTCCIFDAQAWLGQSKAKMLAGWLQERSQLEVKGIESTIQAAMQDDEFTARNFDLVVNGLDDGTARRDVQKLWPSLLVDGAINSIGASVVTHSMDHRGFACMRCTFSEPRADLVEAQQRATGLSQASLNGDANRLLSDADIEAAKEEFRPWLRDQQRKGATVCSTIARGMAERLGLVFSPGFRPSVPFVATASAALVMSQVLRGLYWRAEPFIHEFQFGSMFIGPDTGVRVSRKAAPDCLCTTKRHIIYAGLAARRARC